MTDTAADVVVVGAGAAGMLAAIFAATAGVRTLLIERTADGGRKILISGGGRCNILPAHADDRRFVTDSSPHVLRRILRSWPLREQVAFFEHEAGIPLVEEAETGKLFPASQRARDVRDRLLGMARQRGVALLNHTRVIDFHQVDGRWRVESERGGTISAQALVMATGGLSVPSTGSDGGGLASLERLQHTVHSTYPALTPLTAAPAPFGELAGVSLPVTITARAGELAARATGGFLFTHKGYSGPSVLDVSHVAVRSRLAGSSAPARISVQWAPLTDREWDADLRQGGNRMVLGVLRAHLPDRLARALVTHAGIDADRTLSNLTRQERLRLVDTLVRADLPWTGDEGYRKAEVTGGGVSLSDIDPATMESRKQRGLFLCGELLDAFGPIGGYNFLWAWATGRAAGLGAAACVRR